MRRRSSKIVNIVKRAPLKFILLFYVFFIQGRRPDWQTGLIECFFVFWRHPRLERRFRSPSARSRRFHYDGVKGVMISPIFSNRFNQYFDSQIFMFVIESESLRRSHCEATPCIKNSSCSLCAFDRRRVFILFYIRS